MPPSGEDYVGVVRGLPRPTPAQAERFARFVSGAHSWYKHLPVRPEVPFFFYLDPGSGMCHVHTAGGEIALVPITDERTRFHYTWQMTADYRRRFGHWNYFAQYGTAFLYAAAGGMASTAGAGLTVLSDSGAWVLVPPRLAAAGTARVSALVHPWQNLGIWARDAARFGLAGPSETPDAGGPTSIGDLCRALGDVLRRDDRPRPTVAWLSTRLPPPVLEAVRRFAAARAGTPDPTGAGGTAADDWDWPDQSWLDHLRAAGVDAALISRVVNCIEIEAERTRRRAAAAAGRRPGSAASHASALPELIAEERGRQLVGMADAMGRFADAVYDPA